MNIQYLRRASIIYLLIPNLLFFYFWTDGIVKFLGLAVLTCIFINELRDRELDNHEGLTTRDLWVIGIFSAVIVLLSGISGFVYQSNDYWAHNTKFYELFRYEWPVRIPSDGPIVAYYYGFYLVPAIFSKITGSVNETAIILWTFTGIFLGSSWLYLLVNRKIHFVFLVLTIGDLPHILRTILSFLWGKLYPYSDFGIELWSNFENLFWVPNQIIPALIIGGMLVFYLREQLPIERIVSPIALSFWWAIFPSFTSGLFIAILLLYKWVKTARQIDAILILNHVLLPFLCCIPVLILFLSHEKTPVSGFLLQFHQDIYSTAVEYLVNIGVNILIFFFAYRYLSRHRKTAVNSLPFYLVLLLIVLLPFYRIGKVNDFLFRGMMPLLIIAGLYLFADISALDGVRNRLESVRTSWPTAVLYMLLISSPLLAFGRIARAFSNNRVANQFSPNQAEFQSIPYDTYPNVYEVLRARWSQAEAEQYLGKTDSFYEQYIAPSPK